MREVQRVRERGMREGDERGRERGVREVQRGRERGGQSRRERMGKVRRDVGSEEHDLRENEKSRRRLGQ